MARAQGVRLKRTTRVVVPERVIPAVTEDEFTLTLDVKTAGMLRDLTGNCTSGPLYDVWDALFKNGVQTVDSGFRTEHKRVSPFA